MTQSDAVRERLRYLIIDHIGGVDHRPVQRAQDTTDALANAILSAFPALAQSNAEPVAWRWRWPDRHWFATESKRLIEEMREKGCEIEPLYTAPPRPDASALKEKVDLFDNAVEAGRNAGWDMGIYTPKSLIETLDSELVRLHAIVEQRGVRPDHLRGLLL
jgi:hypothetical protein